MEERGLLNDAETMLCVAVVVKQYLQHAVSTGAREHALRVEDHRQLGAVGRDGRERGGGPAGARPSGVCILHARPSRCAAAFLAPEWPHLSSTTTSRFCASS